MVPILINKNVFERSYNDLKFTAPNRDYVCTNLISVSVLGHFQLINFSAYYESCFPASLHVWWYLDASHCKFCFIRCFLFFFYDSYWALVWDILVIWKQFDSFKALFKTSLGSSRAALSLGLTWHHYWGKTLLRTLKLWIMRFSILAGRNRHYL